MQTAYPGVLSGHEDHTTKSSALLGRTYDTTYSRKRL